MAKITEAVGNFLKRAPHNNPDLVAWWTPQLETQVFVSPEGGFPVEDRRNAWTDGKGDTWSHIRFPMNANAEPYWRDRELTFLLEDHCTFIGSTGWNWVNRESWFVGFDFDDITSHAPGVGVDDFALAEVMEKAKSLPYVDVIKSTGGKGLHLYVRFDRENAPKTANHTEHAAVARALLGKMSTDVAFDFGSHLDVCGHVMWLWGKKSTACKRCGAEETAAQHVNSRLPEYHRYENASGHSWVKKASRPLALEELPPNWRDNIEVISKGGTGKIRVTGYSDGKKIDEQDSLTELASSRVKYDLNDVHKAILNDLEQTGASVVWVADHHLVQTHTVAFKAVFDKWKDAGHRMKGFFETNSQGSDLSKPNCLSGDTKVITRDGLKPIGELAGKTVKVMTTRGKWVDAPFKSYGEQDVLAVTLKKGATTTKVIRATADHRWFVYRNKAVRRSRGKELVSHKEVRTEDLAEGQIFVQVKASRQRRPSVVGIQHGLVWGDGTCDSSETSRLPLYGRKATDLIKFFAEHPQSPFKNSVGGIAVAGLPRHFKSLVPLDSDKGYLYGWLAGYFAADGCVAPKGACLLTSTDKKSIEHVRDVCHILGIESSAIGEVWVKGGFKPCTRYQTYLKATDLQASFFLMEHHRALFNAAAETRQPRYWRVESVVPAGREEVFCCTVPKTGCFCLEDFIRTHNCFGIPGPKGSWFIYRFGKGSAEHKLWSQDDVGWTWCKLNSQPNLNQACLALGGKEDEKGGFVFDTAEAAQETVANIGSKLLLPPNNKYGGRETVLRRHKDGRLVVELKKWEGDEGFDDWIEKKDKWVRIYNINTNSAEEDKDYSEFDALTRSVRTPSNTDAGWMIRAQSEWVRSPATNVVRVLKAVAPGCDENIVMGTAILNQWTLVNMPFHEEHPGGRNWNYGAAQFRYQPSDTEEPKHPHWDRILSHIGEDLDRVVKNTGWCQKWGIQNGRDYLTAWIACMLREPFEPLPYLFIYGDQGCGKSILHEVISLLVTGGVVKADTALTNQSDFNGELANGVLAVIDEKNVASAGPSVYNKIKDWTTSLTLSVHRKGMEPYQQRNSLHFIQLANERDACPVFPGDTRIVVVRMGPLVEEIAKPLLIKRCVEEAPDFMATLMNFQLSESMTRLRLPVLETDAKRSLMDMNTSPLEGFMREHCSERNGRHIVVKDFYEKFQATLSAYERSVWTKSKIRQNLPDRYPIGNYTANKLCVGNLSFDNSPVAADGPQFVSRGGRLKLSTDEGV